MNTLALPARRTVPAVPGWAWSVLFAVLVVVLPWEVVRGDPFADLVNYRTRIEQIFDFGADYFVWDDTILGWLKFEMVWFRLLVAAAYAGIDPGVFFAAITAVSAFLTHRFVRGHVGTLAGFAMLLNPITIDLLSSQIRSAFAFALFLAIVGPVARGWGHLRYLALLALPFIHTALILVSLVWAASMMLARLERIRPLWRMLASVGAALLVAVAMATVLPAIMDAAGDRRELSEYGNKSVAYVAFWFVVGLALALSYSRAIVARWEYHFALIICFVGPMAEAFGLPGFRFVALAIPVILVAAQDIRGPMRHGLIGLTVIYAMLLIHYWIQ